MPAKEIVLRNFKVENTDIVFIKAVLESYEGMVVLRTIEVQPPVIELLIANDFANTIECVIQDLQKQVRMEELAAPSALPPLWP